MARIPSHTIQDAPAASRPLLEDMLQFSPTGRLLTMHAQMAHAPAVLEAYVSIRRATGQHGTLDQPVRTALMLASAVADDSRYALAIISMLALRSGWRRDQVDALLACQDLGEEKTDTLIGVVREAAANSGRVSDATWARAAGAVSWLTDTRRDHCPGISGQQLLRNLTEGVAGRTGPRNEGERPDDVIAVARPLPQDDGSADDRQRGCDHRNVAVFPAD